MYFVPIAIVQDINVTVDGDVISFVGQPPVERGGMILVPLRGVFEKLGAAVFYDGATRSIRAVKGATEVTLRLGSTSAFVNGQARTLALPAQTEQGITLVPLRFVSEALGAQVGWRGESRTVVIRTDAAPVVIGTPREPAAALEVRSLTQDSQRPLRAGEQLAVTLLGTPGAAGSFSISGVESARDIPMREGIAGTYSGVFTVPQGVQVKNAPLFASLKRDGNASPLLQASGAVTLDGIGPQIASLSPAPESAAAAAKLLIYSTLSDVGSGIDKASVRLSVNGADVTERATITEAFFSYRPDPELLAGKTIVSVVAKDMAGNETRREWNFVVSAAAKPAEVPVAAAVAKPTILTPAPNASVGDHVTLTGKADPGASVHYRITFQGSFLILPTSGVVTEGDARADASGAWNVPEIALSAQLGVSKLSYTLEVTTTGANGAASDPVTVKFKK